MYEAFEMLSEEYMKEIQTADTPKEKTAILSELREVRSRMERVLIRLTKEVLGND